MIVLGTLAILVLLPTIALVSGYYPSSSTNDPAIRGALNPIPIGSGVIGTAFDASNGLVYVTDYHADAVTVLNPNTNEIMNTINVGRNPYGITFDSQNQYLYVANSGSGTVSVIDGSSNSVVGTVEVGTTPTGIAYNPTNSFVYVTDALTNGSVYVISSNGLPPNPFSVIKNVTVGANPQGLAVDSKSGTVYVAVEGYGQLVAINGSTQTIAKTISLNQSAPIEVAYDNANNTIFVTNSGSDSISEINGTTNQIITKIGMGPASSSSAAALDGITYDSSKNELLVTSPYFNRVSVIDASTNAITANVSLGSFLSLGEISTDDAAGKAFITSYGSDALYALSLTSNALLGNITLRTAPQNSFFDSANGFVYVTNPGTNTTSVIDGSNGSLIATIQVGADPTQIISASNFVYVANTGSNTVSVIDGTPGSNTLDSVVQSITVGNEPISMALDNKSGDIFVANNGSNTISVYDPSTQSVVNTISTETAFQSGNGCNSSCNMTSPHNLLYDPKTNSLFVTGLTYVCGGVGCGYEATIGIIDPTTFAAPSGVENFASIGSPGSVHLALDGVADTIYVIDSEGPVCAGCGASIFDHGTVEMFMANVTYGFPTSGLRPGVGTFNVGLRLDAIAFDPSNEEMYVAAGGSNSVIAVEPSSTTLSGFFFAANLTVGPDPTALGLDPSNGYIYVADHGSSNVTVIDGGTNTEVQNVTVPEFVKESGCTVASNGAVSGTCDAPTSIATNTQNGGVYVTNQGGDDVFGICNCASFRESGLGVGASWNVTIGGTTYFTTMRTILENGNGSEISVFNLGATSYPWSVSNAISAGPDLRYQASPPSGTVVISGNFIQNITYTEQAKVTVQAFPSKGGTVSPSTPNWYKLGTNLSISATPSAGYNFTGWKGIPVSIVLNPSNPQSIQGFVFGNKTLPQTTVLIFGGGSVNSTFKSNLKIKFNPSSATVSQGNSISTIANVSGTDADVALSWKGLPMGASASLTFDYLTAIPSGVTDTLTITTSTDTPIGTYNVTLSALATTGATAKANFTMRVAGINVTFIESGLPAGQKWSATIGGTTHSSTTDQIVISNVTALQSFFWNVTSPVSTSISGVRYYAYPGSNTTKVQGSAQINIDYVKQYEVAMAVNPSGSGTTKPSGSSNWVNASSLLNISAKAGTGYVFKQWDANTTQIVINGPFLNSTQAQIVGPGKITAYFTPILKLSIGKNQVIGNIGVGNCSDVQGTNLFEGYGCVNPVADLFDPANGLIYVANPGSDSVAVINGTSNKLIDSIAVGPNPVALAYDPENNYIYAANYGADYVSIINASINQVVGNVTVGSAPDAIAYVPLDNNIYVANYYSGTLTVISGPSGTVVKTVQEGNSPTSLVFDPSNGYLYVGEQGEVSIYYVAGGYNFYLSQANSYNIVSLVYDPISTNVYAVAQGIGLPSFAGNVSFNGVTPIYTFGTNSLPQGITFGSTTGDIYVSDLATNNILVIDGNLDKSQNQVVANITAGPNPYGLAFDPLNSELYVTDSGELSTGSANVTAIFTGASPEICQVCSGSVLVTIEGGGSQNVTLSLQGLPSGVTSSWSKNSVLTENGVATDNLTLLVSNTIAAGSYNITVDGNSNFSLSASVNFTLNVVSGIILSSPSPSASIQSLTGLGFVTFDTSAGYFESLSAIPQSSLPSGAPSGVNFPFGFYSWTIGGLTNGETATVTVTFSSNLPTPIQYWKVINGVWVNETSLVSSGYPLGPNALKLTIKDGGQGDTDGTANGQISDPGGVGTSVQISATTSRVVFTESGLPSGTSWSINFNGITYASTTDNITTANVTAGYYSYEIATPIAGSQTGVRYSSGTTFGSVDVPYQTKVAVDFTTQCEVTLVGNPEGAGEPGPGGVNWYNAGSVVQITATANPSYVFAFWSSSSSSITIGNRDSESTSMTVNGPGTIIANFASVSATPNENNVKKTIQLPIAGGGANGGPFEGVFDPANGLIYVASSSPYAIVIMNGTNNMPLETLLFSSEPLSITLNQQNGNVYVLTSTQIVAIDPAIGNRIISNITLPSTNYFQSSQGIMYDSVTGYVYAVSYNGGTVYVINGTSNSIVGTISVGSQPIAITLNSENGNLYVLRSGNPSIVSVIDVSTNAIVTTVSVGRNFGSGWLSFDPANDGIYVLNNFDGTVSVINGSTNTVTATIDVSCGAGFSCGNSLTSISLDSQNGEIFATALGLSSYSLSIPPFVAVIDPSTNTVIRNVSIGSGYLTSSFFDSSNNDLYVVNEGKGTLSIIDTGSYTNVATVQLPGYGPDHLAVDTRNGNLYYTDFSGTLSVVNGMKDTFEKSIVGNFYPTGGVAFDPVNGYVYVAGYGSLFPGGSDGGLAVVNSTTNTVVGVIPSCTSANPCTSSGAPNGVVYDTANGDLYVTHVSGGGPANEVDVVNTTTDSVSTRIMLPVGAESNAVVYDSQNQEVYVQDPADGIVFVINSTTNSIIETIPFPGYSFYGGGVFGALVYDSSNGEIYVSSPQSILAIDGKTNTLNETIPVQGASAFTFDPANGNIYAITSAGGNTFVTGPGAVSVIDGSTNTFVTSIPVGSGATDITYDSFNQEVYVTNNGDNTISVIDGSSNSLVVTTIPIGIEPDGIAYDTINQNAYASNYRDNSISVINHLPSDPLGIYNVTETISVGEGPRGVVFNSNNGYIYVANYNSNSVSVIDGATENVIATIGVGSHPSEIAFDSSNGDLYVTNSGSGTVSIISGSSGTVLATVNVGNDPTGIAYDSSNNNLYVANTIDGTVSVISASSNAVIAGVGVGHSPMGVAYDNANQLVYVTNAASNNVSVINGNTQIVTQTIPTGSQPQAILFDSKNGYIYVANAGDNTMTIIAGSTNIQLEQYLGSEWFTTPQVGLQPVALAFDPVSGDVFVASRASDMITLLNGETNVDFQFSGPPGSAPQGALFDSNNGYFYVPNGQTGVISVINAGTNSTVTTIQTPAGLCLSSGFYMGVCGPFKLAFDPSNHGIYATTGGSLVLVVNDTTNTIVGKIQLQGLLEDITFDPNNGMLYVSSFTVLGSAPQVGMISAINVSTNAVASVIDLPRNANLGIGACPTSVAVDPTSGFLYAEDGCSPASNYGGVDVVNLNTNSFVSTIPMPGSSSIPHLSMFSNLVFDPASGNLYVAGPTADTIWNISTATLSTSVPTTFSLPFATSGIMAFDPHDQLLYILNRAGSQPQPVVSIGYVSLVNVSSGKALKSTSLGFSPAGLVYDSLNEHMFTVNDGAYPSSPPGFSFYGDSTLYEINDAPYVVTGSNNVGSQPRASILDPLNGYIYVANYGSNNVSVLTGTGAILTTIGVGSGPINLVVASDYDYIYVANSLSGTVSVIDGSKNTVIMTVKTGLYPDALAYDSANGNIYVANRNNGTVSVISSSTNSVVKNVTVGTNPDAITYNPVNGNIYVANFGSSSLGIYVLEASSTVSVISGSSNNVIATINTGSATVQNQYGTVLGPGLEPNGLTVDTKNGEVYVANNETAGLLPCANDYENLGCSSYGAIVNVIGGTSLSTSIFVGLTTNQATPINLLYVQSADKVFITASNFVTISGVNYINPSSFSLGSSWWSLGAPLYSLFFDTYDGRLFVAGSDGSVWSFVVSPGLTASDGTFNAGSEVDSLSFTQNSVLAFGNSSNTVATIGTTDTSVISVSYVNAKSDAILFDSLNAKLFDTIVNDYYGSQSYLQNIYVAEGDSNSISVSKLEFVSCSTSATYLIDCPIPPPYPISGWYYFGMPTIAVGSDPVALTLDTSMDYIYVANYGSNSVSVINGANDTVIYTITVGTNPSSIAYDSSNGYVYVTNSGSGTVSVIDVSSVIATITVGSSPQGVLYDSLNNDVYVANSLSGTVSVINAATDSIVSTITVGSQPYALALDTVNGNIYVANYGSNSVSVISGSTGNITSTVPVGSSPDALTFDPINGYVYVANSGSNTVSELDGSANIVLDTIATGHDPTAIMFDPTNDGANHGIYVVCTMDNSIFRIDTFNFVSKNQIQPELNPVVVGATTKGNVYVAETSSSPISSKINVINDSLNAFASRINASCSAFTFDSSNGYVYGICTNSAQTVTLYESTPYADYYATFPFIEVYVFNATSGSIVATIQFPSNPISSGFFKYPAFDGLNDIAFDSSNGLVYVTDTLTEVYVINPSTNGIVTTISVASASSIAVDTTHGEVFVATSTTVAAIDAATNTVKSYIPLSIGTESLSAFYVVFDSANGLVYASSTGACGFSCTILFVIDGSSNTEVQAITLPNVTPGPMVFDSAQSEIYILSRGIYVLTGEVYIFDPSIGTIVAAIPVGNQPGGGGLAFDPTNDYIYVINNGAFLSGGSSVTVINGTANVIHPSIYVIKSVTPSLVKPGQTVSISATIANVGDTTLTNIKLVDSTLGTIPCPISTLSPGQSETCTGTNTAPESAGIYSDTMTVSGTDPAGVTITAQSFASYTVAFSAIQVSEVFNSASAHVGQTVEVTASVLNSGNTVLSGIEVTSNAAGALSCPQDSLAIGASESCTGSFIVPSGAGSTFTDNATAYGTDPTGTIVNSKTSNSISILSPYITISETITPSTVSSGTAGMTLTVNATVTNTGNTQLGAIKANDLEIGSLTCKSTLLAPGAVTFCSGTLSSPPTPGTYPDVVTATGVDQLGESVSARGGASFTVLPQIYYEINFLQTGSQVAPTVDYVLSNGTIGSGLAPFTINIYADAGLSVTYNYQTSVPDITNPTAVQYSLTGVNDSLSFAITSSVSIMGTYVTQYLVSFTQNGLDPSAQGAVLSLDGSNITANALPFSEFVNAGTSINFYYYNTVASGFSGERFNLTSVSSGSCTTNCPVTITSPLNVVGNFELQYLVGIQASPSSGGTTMPVSGTSNWYNSGSQISINASASSGYLFERWDATSPFIEFNSPTSPQALATINDPGTISADFSTPYTITFSESGLPASVSWSVTFDGSTQSAPGSTSIVFQVGSGTYSWSVSSPISGGTGVQYVTGTSSGTMDVPTVTSENIQFNTQYQVTFGTNGLDSSATGTVVTVDGNPISFSFLPFSEFVNSGTTVNFAYSSPVQSSNSGEYFDLTGVSGNSTASTAAINSPATVTGSYVLEQSTSTSTTTTTVTSTTDTTTTVTMPTTTTTQTTTTTTTTSTGYTTSTATSDSTTTVTSTVPTTITSGVCSDPTVTLTDTSVTTTTSTITEVVTLTYTSTVSSTVTSAVTTISTITTTTVVPVTTTQTVYSSTTECSTTVSSSSSSTSSQAPPTGVPEFPLGLTFILLLLTPLLIAVRRFQRTKVSIVKLDN